MNNVANKVVWITGASSGIGEALAINYSKRGAKVILSARREEELNRVANSCSGETFCQVLDLSKTDDFESIVISSFNSTLSIHDIKTMFLFHDGKPYSYLSHLPWQFVAVILYIIIVCASLLAL